MTHSSTTILPLKSSRETVLPTELGSEKFGAGSPISGPAMASDTVVKMKSIVFFISVIQRVGLLPQRNRLSVELFDAVVSGVVLHFHHRFSESFAVDVTLIV